MNINYIRGSEDTKHCLMGMEYGKKGVCKKTDGEAINQEDNVEGLLSFFGKRFGTISNGF